MINKKSLFLLFAIATIGLISCKPKSGNITDPPEPTITSTISLSEDVLFINTQDDDIVETAVTIRAFNASGSIIPLTMGNTSLAILDAEEVDISSENFTVSTIVAKSDGSASFTIRTKANTLAGSFTVKASISLQDQLYTVSEILKVKDASKSGVNTKLTDITLNKTSLTIDLSNSSSDATFQVSSAKANITGDLSQPTHISTSLVSVMDGATNITDKFIYSASGNTVTLTAKSTVPVGSYLVTIRVKDSNLEVGGKKTISLTVTGTKKEEDNATYTLTLNGVTNNTVSLKEEDPDKILTFTLKKNDAIVTASDLTKYTISAQSNHEGIVGAKIVSGNLVLTPVSEGTTNVTLTVKNASQTLASKALTINIEEKDSVDTIFSNIELDKVNLNLDLANPNTPVSIDLISIQGNTGTPYDPDNIKATIVKIENGGDSVTLDNFDLVHANGKSVSIKTNEKTASGVYTITIEYEDTTLNIKGTKVITLTVKDSDNNTITDTKLENITLNSTQLNIDIYKPTQLATFSVTSAKGDTGTSWNINNIIASITKVEEAGINIALDNFEINRENNKTLTINPNTKTKVGTYLLTVEIEDALAGIKGSTTLTLTVQDSTPKDTKLSTIDLNKTSLELDRYLPLEYDTLAVSGAKGDLGHISNINNLRMTITKIEKGGVNIPLSDFDIIYQSLINAKIAPTINTTIGTYTLTVEVENTILKIKGSSTVSLTVKDTSPADTKLDNITFNKTNLTLDLGDTNKNIDFQITNAQTNESKTPINLQNITPKITKITNSQDTIVTDHFTLSHSGANFTLKAVNGKTVVGEYFVTLEITDNATNLKGSKTITLEVIDSKAGYRIYLTKYSWTPTKTALSTQLNATVEFDGVPLTTSDYRFAIDNPNLDIDFSGGIYIGGLWSITTPKGDYSNIPQVIISLILQDRENKNILDDDGNPITVDLIVILGSDLS